MPDEAFIIENAPLGVKAGVAAGVFTIAVNTGPIPEKQLQEAGADLIYPDMSALQKSICRNYWPDIITGPEFSGLLIYRISREIGLNKTHCQYNHPYPGRIAFLPE